MGITIKGAEVLKTGEVVRYIGDNNDHFGVAELEQERVKGNPVAPSDVLDKAGSVKSKLDKTEKNIKVVEVTT